MHFMHPLSIFSMTFSALFALAFFLSPVQFAAAEPMACTMEAKLCPDGKTYVGRDSNNNCQFSPCPGESSSSACTQVCRSVGTRSEGWYDSCTGKLLEYADCSPSPSCSPYMCSDGTTVPRCTDDGTVINYFMAPCQLHGGEQVKCGSTEQCPSDQRCSIERGDCQSACGPDAEFCTMQCMGVCESVTSFPDVPSTHINAKAIAYLKMQGIVSGNPDGTFHPERQINRAEFTKIVMGIYADDGRLCKLAPFDDVSMEEWYGPSIYKALCNAIISGYPDHTFRPGASINFAEAAKIIVKSMGLKVGETDIWYESYVRAMASSNAIPVSITSLDQKITRGEMAEMIWRMKVGITTLPSKTYEELSVETATVGAGCVVGGCSAEICSDVSEGSAVSNCLYVPAYACYKTATCERQNNGACGWTQTSDLQQCLSDAQ